MTRCEYSTRAWAINEELRSIINEAFDENDGTRKYIYLDNSFNGIVTGIKNCEDILNISIGKDEESGEFCGDVLFQIVDSVDENTDWEYIDSFNMDVLEKVLAFAKKKLENKKESATFAPTNTTNNMDYINEITKIARIAIKEGEGEVAGNGMYNFSLRVPKFRGVNYEYTMIFQVYPYTDYGDAYLLAYYDVKGQNFVDHDDISFNEMSADEKEYIFNLFKKEYGFADDYEVSGVLTFIPKINSSKPLSHEEFISRLKTILSSCDDFVDFDLHFADGDGDLRNEKTDITNKVKVHLKSLGYEHTDAIVSAKVNETKEYNGTKYEYIYVDWGDKGPGYANLAIVSINDEWYTFNGGYPLSLAEARCYTITANGRDFYVMDNKYRLVIASTTTTDGKPKNSTIYDRLVSLNNLSNRIFDGVVLVREFTMGTATCVEFHDAVELANYDENGSAEKPSLYRAWFYSDEVKKPYRVEKVDILMNI